MAIDRFKVILVVVFVVVIGGAILGYLAISKERAKLDRILKVELPMERTVREIEVSIWESANAISYYMIEPSATSLGEYKKQLKDVEEFMSRYKVLIDTEQEKKMVTKFERIWADSVSKAEELIRLRNKMTKLREKVWDSVHEADDVIDYKVQVAFVEGLPDLIEKEKSVREVEVNMWEAISAANYYGHGQFNKAARGFPARLADVDEFWGRYRKLNITSAEEPHIKEFEDNWNRSVELVKESHALADELTGKYLAFWESVHEIDDVIDFEIQEYLKERLNKR